MIFDEDVAECSLCFKDKRYRTESASDLAVFIKQQTFSYMMLKIFMHQVENIFCHEIFTFLKAPGLLN